MTSSRILEPPGRTVSLAPEDLSAYRAWLIDHDMPTALADAILDAMPPTDWSNIARREEMAAGFAGVHARLDQHGQHLSQVDRRLDQIDARLDRLDDRFDQSDGRFDQVEGRFEGSDARTESLTVQVKTLADQTQSLTAQIGGLGSQTSAMTSSIANMAVQMATLGTQTGRALVFGFGTMLIGFVSVIVTVVLAAGPS